MFKVLFNKFVLNVVVITLCSFFISNLWFNIIITKFNSPTSVNPTETTINNFNLTISKKILDGSEISEVISVKYE